MLRSAPHLNNKQTEVQEKRGEKKSYENIYEKKKKHEEQNSHKVGKSNVLLRHTHLKINI